MSHTKEEVASMRETLIVFGPHSEAYYLNLTPTEVVKEYDRLLERGKHS